MNVWKIASRWSYTGTKQSSVLDIFRKYGIVFAGRETEKIKKSVQKGDLIAISDGLKVVSIAKVISLPSQITYYDIKDEDKQRFDYENWVVTFRVEIYNLSKDEIFTTKMGTFHGMGKYSNRIKELYNSKLTTASFEINTYTYTLLDAKSPEKSLIQEKLKYIIPVYQRPYSWGETQIETFINDIFISFWGTEKKSESESIFIGTMQLSEKKYSEENNDYQEIIDGQQRISTLTLLIKVLSEKYKDNEKLKSFDFKWIDTDVNRGQQSKDLKEVLFKKNVTDKDQLNKYAINYKLLKEYFEQSILIDKAEDEKEFKEDDFITHLLTRLYFVVIETKAGLSKTLQIFNAINSTGLDLNNTDIFKIRLYEYLSNSGDDKQIFENIDRLYEKIDIENSKENRKVTDMNGILSIYKSFIISKYSLNMTLWKMATSTFFERLFDTLLEIKEWSGFSIFKEKDKVLYIADIDKIIDVRYRWENKHYGKSGTFDDFNTMLSLRLLWWSRYSNYWNLAFLYLLRDDATDEKYNQLIQELSRLYISYTLIYQKQINSIHQFTKDIFQKLITNPENIDEVINDIKVKYISQKERIEQIISGDIFWNPKIKNILTRMSAAIEENKTKKSIKEIEKLIFDTKIDIEHIKSRNDDDFKDDEFKEEWKDTLNTIGNLVILEYSINRSIGNNPFEDKIKEYKESEFHIVADFPEKFPSWKLDIAEKRKKEEISKISRFLYPKVSKQ